MFVRRSTPVGLTIALTASLATALVVAGSLSPVGADKDGKGSTLNEGTPDKPRKEQLYDADKDKLFENLEDALDLSGEHEPIPVVAVFNKRLGEPDMNDLRGLIGSFMFGREYRSINGASATLTKAQIRALSRSGLVKHIELDGVMSILLDNANRYTGAAEARGDYGVDGNADGSASSYSAADIVWAVLDTGIDAGHVDLDGGKVIGWRDFINGQPSPYDDHSHGTHVASIIAGEGQANAAYRGVAPGAALVGVKVLNSGGSGSISGIDAGIQWVIDNRVTYGIEGINMSLGTSGCSNGSDSTSLLINQAVAQGITVVVAAGNSGPSTCTIGSPGAAENAITVGSMQDPGHLGFTLSSFSSRGPTSDNRSKPDVAAPGARISAARANTGNGYVEMSGTSMASPFTAGVAALMLDRNPGLTPAIIKSLLQDTAVDWGKAGKDIDYGSGVVDARRAVAAAAGGSSNASDMPPHVYFSGSLGGTGAANNHPIEVTSTSFPIGVTMTMSSGVDFDMELRNPSGVVVGRSDGVSRQETIGYQPPGTGTYTLRVYSYSGSGTYSADVSAGSSGSSPSPTPTPSPAPTATPAPTPTPSATATPSPSPTPGPTSTPSPSPTPSPTPGPSQPLFFALAFSATLDGVSVANEDIVYFDGTAFSLYFDGSDVGLSSYSIDGFHRISATELLLSLNESAAISGISGTVDDSDIILFTGTSLGSNTAGTFSLYFDGSDVGLTTSDEDVDGVGLLPDGRVLVSTRGTASVSGVTAADEDILVFSPTSLGATTAGSWATYFDGGDVQLGQTGEDLDGIGRLSDGGLLLTTEGSFSTSAVSGADEDVFVFRPSGLGTNTSGTFDAALYFDGSTHGLSGNDLVAVEAG